MIAYSRIGKYNENEGGMFMIYTLDEIKKRIIPVIEKYSIPAMYLFGSYARGEATEGKRSGFPGGHHGNRAYLSAVSGSAVLRSGRGISKEH